MKKENLKNRATEKLEGELKAIKIVSIILLGALILLFITSIYGLIRVEKNSIFIGLIAVLPIQFIIMGKIQNELKSRKNNKL